MMHCMTSLLPAINYRPPPHTGLDILFQDKSLLVLSKPSGLLSVPGRGPDKQDSLAWRVQQEYPEALTIHRLDMETSGLVVMAKNTQIHRHMSLLFQERHVQKLYIAVVDGLIAQHDGNIDLPLITDWPNRPKQKIDHDSGKASVTHYKVIEQDSQLSTSRVELRPVTGRSHQLRVHMQSLGHAILGDRLYGCDRVQGMAGRLQLHACRLAFRHPVSHESLEFTHEVPF